MGQNVAKFHLYHGSEIAHCIYSCRNRSMCPLQNKCLTPNIVYQADITNIVDDKGRVYPGLSETPFKDRYRNHVRDFNNEIHCNKTEFYK